MNTISAEIPQIKSIGAEIGGTVKLSGYTNDHAGLANRDASDQHPISAITGLQEALNSIELTPGEDGSDGKSAYEIALEHGFKGSETEWLASLTGAQGQKGDTGATGPQGPQGEKGAAGSQGPKGDTGASVTVKSVNESTADGGSNVVTFSDGQTVTIKNGTKGSTGAQSPKGDTGASGTSVTVKSVSESTTDGGSNVVTFSDGQTVTIKNGTKGSTGAQGPKGDTGASGTSVTVKSVSESTTDGGSNVVTFSDGQTVTIKNGTKGSTGPQGPKGDTGAVGPQGPSGSNMKSVLLATDTLAEETLLVIDPTATASKIPEWYNGTEVSLKGHLLVDGSAAGDYYINTNTFDVFYATAPNTWKHIGNIKGGNGSTGIFFGAYDGSDGQPPQDAVLWIDPNEAANTEFLTTNGLAAALSDVDNRISYVIDNDINALTTYVYKFGKILIQAGYHEINITTANSAKTATIYFSKLLGTYSAAPRVITNASSSNPLIVGSSIGGTTTEQFTLYGNRSNTGWVNVRWLSIGICE